MHAKVNNGDNTIKRRVSRSGQSDASEGKIMIPRGCCNDNRKDNERYDACRINVDGIVISDASPTQRLVYERKAEARRGNNL